MRSGKEWGHGEQTMRRILVCVIALTVVNLAHADDPNDDQVNVSGATLFADFFGAPASTNDWIDVDNDGIYGFDEQTFQVDQLADTYSTNPSWDPHWIVNYRGVGSGNGLSELVNFYNATPTFGYPSDYGMINRVFYSEDGLPVPGIGDPNNPGGSPVAQNRVDIAVMDVPTTWFVVSGDVASSQPQAKPTEAGYGRNPVKSWNTARSNTLKSLGSLNLNTEDPDSQTVFDTPIAWVPIAIIANAGVSNDPNYTTQDLRYLYQTGRMPNGENLVAATRDSGSGTRNGGMNTLGLDPSWARGDNLGNQLGDAEIKRTLAMPSHQSTNLGGSSIMEAVIQHNRLALGYTGLAGSSRAAKDATDGKYEILSVQQPGGTAFVRPSLDGCLDNANPDTGWRIGGDETFATVGDPFAATTGNPNMIGNDAADYVRNIVQSSLDFADPNSTKSDQYNMPGEFLAYTFFLEQAVDALPDPLNPTDFQTNTQLNQTLQDFTRDNSDLLPSPAFASVNPAGRCPQRASGYVYSDGRGPTNLDYIDAGGNDVPGGDDLAARNRIAGDFLYDGQRNLLDIPNLMTAYANPRAFEAGVDHGGDAGEQAGDYVIVEVIGDFNTDGSFTSADVRYFADGLAINSATDKLDRPAGFVAVDTNWTAGDPNHPAGNFFNTQLATGRAYLANSGWSRADVAGAGTAAPGLPAAGNGLIDGEDITYAHKILRYGIRQDAYNTREVDPTVRSNQLLWSDEDDALWMDLTCDMDGDFDVDADDVDYIIYTVLGASHRDVNLDGMITAEDRQTIVDNIDPATSGRTWTDGDIDGDGFVTDYDLWFYDSLSITGDLNGDGIVNLLDLALLSQNWLVSN